MQHSWRRWVPSLAALLFCSVHSAETVIIDCGSAADSNFSGGVTWIIPQALLPPGTTDTTLRYGAAFSYRIPVDNIPYVVTFRFIEPTVQVRGQRIFSVRINNQVVVDRIDLIAEAGYLKSLSRSIVVMGSDESLNICFETQMRSAVVSSIEITQFYEWTLGPVISLLGYK